MFELWYFIVGRCVSCTCPLILRMNLIHIYKLLMIIYFIRSVELVAYIYVYIYKYIYINMYIYIHYKTAVNIKIPFVRIHFRHVSRCIHMVSNYIFDIWHMAIYHRDRCNWMRFSTDIWWFLHDTYKPRVFIIITVIDKILAHPVDKYRSLIYQRTRVSVFHIRF